MDATTIKGETGVVKQNQISPEIVSELKQEIDAMLSYAIQSGVIINIEINNLLQKDTQGDLLNAYNLLVKNIAPVTPKSIVYTNQLREEEKTKSFLHRVPLVRNLLVVTIFFLFAFIITGMSPGVNNESLNKGIMENNGMNLLLNIGFLSSVAGLGVLFFLLKKISVAINLGTLVPEESISYITQVILGIVSGLIVSEIISFYTTDSNGINTFSKTVLALIGGFSSDSIFAILQGVIDRVKSIFITK